MYSIIFQFEDSLNTQTIIIKEIRPRSSKQAIDSWNRIQAFGGYTAFSAVMTKSEDGVISKKLISFEEVEALTETSIDLIIQEARTTHLKYRK